MAISPVGTDTRQVLVVVKWEDGSPTTYQRSAREVPALMAELLATYGGEWSALSVTVRP
jgi:hypothetical protein